MRNLVLMLFSCMLLHVSAQHHRPSRVPASPHPFDYVQPDGDTLTLRLHGDERYHYRATLDGYQVMQDKQGRYCYAKKKCNGQPKLTNKQAHNENKRTECEQKFLLRKGLKR